MISFVSLFLGLVVGYQTVVLEDSISLSHDFVNRSNVASFIEFLGIRKSSNFMEKPEIVELIDNWRARIEP